MADNKVAQRFLPGSIDREFLVKTCCHESAAMHTLSRPGGYIFALEIFPGVIPEQQIDFSGKSAI
jgi:hypothetical protein